MNLIHVAVGIIINQDNQILITKRASHQHQGNKWEFPGGKVEDSETSQEALRRELQEELGIEIKSATPLTDIIHQYKDKKVLLDVYEIKDWSGEAIGREGQPLRWVEKAELEQYEFPEANAQIISSLTEN